MLRRGLPWLVAQAYVKAALDPNKLECAAGVSPACDSWCSTEFEEQHCPMCACQMCEVCTSKDLPDNSSHKQAGCIPLPDGKDSHFMSCKEWCAASASEVHCTRCDCQGCDFCSDSSRRYLSPTPVSPPAAPNDPPLPYIPPPPPLPYDPPPPPLPNPPSPPRPYHPSPVLTPHHLASYPPSDPCRRPTSVKPPSSFPRSDSASRHSHPPAPAPKRSIAQPPVFRVSPCNSGDPSCALTTTSNATKLASISDSRWDESDWMRFESTVSALSPLKGLFAFVAVLVLAVLGFPRSREALALHLGSICTFIVYNPQKVRSATDVNDESESSETSDSAEAEFGENNEGNEDDDDEGKEGKEGKEDDKDDNEDYECRAEWRSC